MTIERPKSAEIEVKLIGKCGSPAKLPKTEPASTILQWLDACDPLPTIAAKLQQRHLRTKQKEQPDWENGKGQQPQEGTGSAHSLVIAMGIHVGGIKPNSIFDGCDLDLGPKGSFRACPYSPPQNKYHTPKLWSARSRMTGL